MVSTIGGLHISAPFFRGCGVDRRSMPPSTGPRRTQPVARKTTSTCRWDRRPLVRPSPVLSGDCRRRGVGVSATGCRPGWARPRCRAQIGGFDLKADLFTVMAAPCRTARCAKNKAPQSRWPSLRCRPGVRRRRCERRTTGTQSDGEVEGGTAEEQHRRVFGKIRPGCGGLLDHRDAGSISPPCRSRSFIWAIYQVVDVQRVVALRRVSGAQFKASVRRRAVSRLGGTAAAALPRSAGAAFPPAAGTPSGRPVPCAVNFSASRLRAASVSSPESNSCLWRRSIDSFSARHQTGHGIGGRWRPQGPPGCVRSIAEFDTPITSCPGGVPARSSQTFAFCRYRRQMDLLRSCRRSLRMADSPGAEIWRQLPDQRKAQPAGGPALAPSGPCPPTADLRSPVPPLLLWALKQAGL